MLVLRPRRDLLVVALVAASLAGLLGHALRLAATQDAAPTGVVLNPVLWVLNNDGQYSLSEAGLSLLLLTVSVVALATMRHLRSAQRPRPTRQAAYGAAPTSRAPVAPRVWGGLVRVIWRQSSVVSEIGIAAVLGAAVCFVASILLMQGRCTHGYTALLVAAGFGALPSLGRSQGVALTMVPLYLLIDIDIGVPSWPFLGIRAAAVGSWRSSEPSWGSPCGAPR